MHWTEEFFDEYYLKSSDPHTGAEQTARETGFIISKTNLPKDSPVLDLACGLGRHCIELAKNGYSRITGLDLTSAYLEIARDKAKDLPDPPKFIQGNMQEFNEEQAYQLIYSLFSSIFYFDDQHNLDIVKRVYNALMRGGFFIIDYFNPINFLNKNKLRDWYITDDEYLVLEKYQHNPISGIISIERIIITPEGRRIKRIYHLRDYTVAELRYHFESIGFEILNVYGNFDDSKYSLDSPRQIFVMRKPE
ncbi:MAG: class I SAM-dependent methyltransferase [Calditrichaceae bacterium]|nr:class I SAM-dependent methyltransferase [Calditrichaceae bacterium]MBN2707949.1 class I SAM-dependent methyltransferase [Calditrichaceae bacterium]RQV95949.1 MAG: class I SAM-dependent methyltransferase [Calditrichota bacterium]